MDRRLIEEFLPVKELSKEAKREKAIRHGHISTLHVWWARKPLVVSRAAVFASLVNAPQSEEEKEDLPNFLIRLCKWETRDDERMENSDLKKARERILSANGGKPPKVLDSMAGGGSIPLEALRLGCEAHAIEYNPVAYLILKATLEYPQKYGRRLARDVERWGHWVLDRAKEELEEFYPTDVEEIVSITGSSMIFYSGRTTPVAYIWSRTIRCPSPSCGAEIPLFRQFWLARKLKKKVALFPVVDRENKRVDFEILQGRELEDAIKWGFNPSEGTVKRAKAICPVCGAAISDKYVRQEAKEGRMGHRLVAVVTTAGRGRGRNYRIANEKDLEAFRKAERRLEEIKKQPSPWAFGLSWIPDEPMNQNDPNLVSGRGYGFKRWGELFNPRQALALVTFGKWVREAYREIIKETDDPEYARAVVTYLGFGVDKWANWMTVLSRWHVVWQMPTEALTGHRLAMVFDYAEPNPLTEMAGSWKKAIGYLVRPFSEKTLVLKDYSNTSIQIILGSADSLFHKEHSLDAVIVDPPYYDNVPYADLSDFFYVWLKRTVGDLYPEAFKTLLVPKDEEIVHNPARWGGGKKGEEISKAHFERLLTQAFKEIHRVLKPDGIAVIMFTHRSTTAWEKLIESLLEADLYPTASWPVHTEMEASTHTRGKGSLRSTVLLATRKRVTSEIGWYQQVKSEMEEVLFERLVKFWDYGLYGADFFIAAFGPGMEVFGKYKKVLTPQGIPVRVSDMLNDIRTFVGDFALEQIFKDGIGEVDPPTRLYLLWRWAYGYEEVLFDEARKLAQAEGVEVDDLLSTGFFKKKSEKMVLLGPLDRPLKSFEKEIEGEMPLINHILKALQLWNKGEELLLQEHLRKNKLLDNDLFWKVAQTLHDVTLDSNSDENRLLGQFLPSKESLRKIGRLF